MYKYMEKIKSLLTSQNTNSFYKDIKFYYNIKFIC